MPTRAPKHSTAAAAAAMMDPTSARAEETQALARDVPDGASDSGSAESKEPEYMYYYQKHGGDMRFCCGGRCMIGPKIDNEYMAFAWLAILVPSGVYFGWAAPLLWENWGPRLPVSAASLLVATVVSMLATMFTDPGFIMKNGQPPPKNPSTDYIRNPVFKHIRTDIGTYPFTWCPDCKIWRPPYAHHCRDCNHCVLGFDHHCPFVNNCIGVRNHFYFVTFISCVCGLGVVVLIGTVSAMYIKSELQKGEDVALSEDKQMLVLIFMAIPVTFLTIVLVLFVLFHTVYLPCCGHNGYMKDGVVSCLKQICCWCCKEEPQQREIEAGARAGTLAFCKRNKPKREMQMASPTPGGGAAEPTDGLATPATPAAKAGGYAPVGAPTPARHKDHPYKSASNVEGAELLALDKGKLSGVVGWEVSDGATTKMCMDRLMQPRRHVLKEPGLRGHDSCTDDNV